MADLRPAVHRTILVVDVEGFGDRRRTNRHQLSVRDGLYRALRRAFEKAGIPWSACHQEDRGDGVFVLAPAEVPKARFVDSLPGELAGALRGHNRSHGPHERIRLRMALHAGEINYDEHGVTAASINFAFRLADAAPLKAALAGSPGVLALITSEWFFDEVVRHCSASDPLTYRPVRVSVKETSTTGWVCLPDHPYDPEEATGPAEPDAEPPHPESTQRPPWMAPPLDRMVERPELTGRLLTALTAPQAREVGLTTGLQGAGGFGKTTLATWVCHHDEIRRHFSGGLLWVTVGQDLHDTELAERVNDLSVMLGRDRPAVSSPDAAGAELGRLLDEREPVLLIIDDVWAESQLRPFRFGGTRCIRLITTRIPDVLPASGTHITVDAMSGAQARQLVADGVPGLATVTADRLGAITGRWPVLLNLVNGVLQRRVDRGQPVEEAAEEAARRLLAHGPAVLDPARPADRSRAVGATVEASLSMLRERERECYLDLAVFPEDVGIPLEVLRLLWPEQRADALCEELARLGLVADYRMDAPGPRLLLHDVIRSHLRSRRGPDGCRDVHRRLVDAAAERLPAPPPDRPRPWWSLRADSDYLFRFLPYHLYEAGHEAEMAALVCDLRWVEAKTRKLGSAVPVKADLQLARTPVAETLRRALGGSAALLAPIDPPGALGATLASRLSGVDGLEEVVDRYRARLPRPRLEPARPLPDLPAPALIHTLTGHAGGVWSVAFSPDSALLASGDHKGTVRMWSVAEGTELGLLTGNTGQARDLAFSPAGDLLASSDYQGTIWLWDVAGRAPRAVLTNPTGGAQKLAFSPDGRLLATGGLDRAVRLWDVAEQTVRAELTGHTDRVTSVAISPDGQVLASTGRDRTIRLWRAATGTILTVLVQHSHQVNSVGFSPDGRLLASADEAGTVLLWDVEGETLKTTLTGHTAGVSRVCFSPDGRLLASAGRDRTVRLWDLAAPGACTVLTGHTHQVNGIAFSSDGRLLASGGTEGTLRVWDVPAAVAEHGATADSSDRVWAAGHSPDGQWLATAHSDHTVRLWTAATGLPHGVLAGHDDQVVSVGFSPDGRSLASGGHDGTVCVWDMPSARRRAMLQGHTDWVTGLAWHPHEPLLASAGYEGAVRLWNVDTATEHTVRHTGAAQAWAVAFAPDGRWLATGHSDHSIRLWDVTGLTQEAVFSGHTNWVWALAFSPDGRLLASAGYDGVVRLWDLAAGSPHAVLTGHTHRVHAVAFSPDGRLLASAGHDQTVRLWDPHARQAVCALRVAAPLDGLAWHPHEASLTAVGAGGVYALRHLA